MEFIKTEYKEKSICFKIDKSAKVANFGTLLFLSTKAIFYNNFENQEDCELVALNEKK